MYSSVGVLKCWVYSSVGCPQVLGVLKCWVSCSVGCPQVLGVLKCWVYSSVGCTQVLGVLKCWCTQVLGVAPGVEPSPAGAPGVSGEVGEDPAAH